MNTRPHKTSDIVWSDEEEDKMTEAEKEEARENRKIHSRSSQEKKIVIGTENLMET